MTWIRTSDEIEDGAAFVTLTPDLLFGPRFEMCMTCAALIAPPMKDAHTAWHALSEETP